ncbi:MAG: SusC/RagA family TonB-linked outer membrane protein [Pseudarcicella sp.]|nr:SusC/RagA family TonB-linked outer membrane protein [Pseudarcicella sp.]
MKNLINSSHKIKCLNILVCMLSISLASNASKQKNTSDTIAKSNRLYLPMGAITDKVRTPNFISKVDNEKLIKYPDFTLGNSLQGRLLGLVAIQKNDDFNTLNPSFYLRGISRNNGAEALVLVDGIKRPLSEVQANEIESVQVLKDASAKILYGAEAANGVILITTKTGSIGAKTTISYEQGVNMLSERPTFLDSYRYAQLYNEAANNDGLSDVYSNALIEGYRNSSGNLDKIYPNHDFYDYFIKNTSTFRRTNLQYNFGNEDFKALLFAGYVNGTGFHQNIPDNSYHRINARANVTAKLSEIFSTNVNLSGRIEFRHLPSIQNDDFWTAMSTHRPNEYVYEVNNKMLPVQTGTRAMPNFGASQVYPNSLYAIAKSGTITQQNSNYWSNIGVKLDLNKYVKGLRASLNGSFDVSQSYNYGRIDKLATYADDVNTQFAKDTLLFRKAADPLKTKPDSLITLLKDTTLNQLLQKPVLQPFPGSLYDEFNNFYTIYGNVAYERNFGALEYLGELNFFRSVNDLQKDNFNYNSFDKINTNYTFRNILSYDKKYQLDLTLALMGSNFYEKSTFFSPAVGVSWIASNENFLKNSSSISFLKLKANYGIVGYDGDRIPFFDSKENRYQIFNDAVKFGSSNGTSMATSYIYNLANKDSEWEQTQDLNLGLEMAFLKNKLNFEFNYFNTLRTNIMLLSNYIDRPASEAYFPFDRTGSTAMNGFETQISLNNKVRDFSYDIGLNLTYAKSEITQNAGLSFPITEDAVGYSPNAIFGYQSSGVIKSETQLNSGAIQTLGKYGIGDLAYTDLNNDGIINDFDKSQIGNSFPITTLGLDMNFKYKNVQLSILGIANLGHDRLLDNNFSRPGQIGLSKFSVLAENRFHPVNNPNGTLPVLHTETSRNNNVNSTFWLEDASFFRIKNVELAYQLNEKSILGDMKFYVRGTNLLTFSKNEHLDAEVLNAGLTNVPVYKTITAGFNLNF